MSINPVLEQLVSQPTATIQDVWQARLALSPNETFLIFKGRKWSYNQAWQEICRFGNFAHARKTDEGEYRILSYLGNQPETLWTWFGTIMAGGVYAPLNRSHKGAILEDMFNRGGSDILVTEASAFTDLPSLDDKGIRTVVFIDHIPEGAENLANQVISFADIEEDHRDDFMVIPDPFDKAVVIYTSGTTGRSKAVALPHNLFAHQASRVVEIWEMTAEDVYHSWLPHFHIAGCLHQTMAMIVAGGTVALFERYSASRFRAELQEVGATIVVGLPNVVNIMWNRPKGPEDENPLRLMVSTAINPDIHKAFEKRFALKLLEQYGMTEAELVTVPGLSEQVPPGSCGKAGPDWDVAIVDDRDCILPTGQIGEIVTRPKYPGMMMMGYEGDNEATVAAFRNLWFHTGDFGEFDKDGYLYYRDRQKHVIRRRSENISAMELERIIEQHPDIHEVAAIGVPSPLGEEDVKVSIQLIEDSTLTEKEIHQFCADKMAKFMVPKYIEIIEEFPRTDVGKIAKEDLKYTDNIWDADKV